MLGTSMMRERQPEQPELLLGMPAIISSEAMRQVVRVVQRVAQCNAAVFITGETGTGKELIARALHHFSLRCNMPWVDINCGALPEHLVESELFGYEKGAFSGADQAKSGLFELAHTGTLFLDEVGELHPRMQVKLLRVLDGVPYFRLGGVKKINVDVRIIAATNQNLEEAIRDGKFRSDLFHRLSQVHIHVPPLRERRDDIAPLAEFFLEQQDPRLRLSADVQDVLGRYHWPGNVRELRNAVMRAALLVSGGKISVSDLPATIRSASRVKPSVPLTGLDEMERQMILQVLDQTGGHHTKAAELLGISRRTLSRKLRQYGVSSACANLATC